MNMKTINRNHCMDTIKGIACILVVFIHYNWSNDLSEAIKAIGRFAVPYFFFVAGYHLPDRDGIITAGNTARKLRHLLQLMLKSALFYAFFCVAWNYLMDNTWDIRAFMQEELTPWSITKLFITCDPIYYAHFWYLLASVLCYGVLYVVRDKPGKTGYLAAFLVLLGTYCLFAEYKGLLGWKNQIQVAEGCSLMISNTFLLRAMPFILFGVYLKKARIAERSPINFWVLLAAAVAGCMLVVLEQRKFGIVLMYTGTHLTTIALSLMSIWFPGKSLRALEYVGSKLSMDVYIYHIAVGKILDLAAGKLHLWGSGWFKPARPILALIGSLLVAQIIVSIRNAVKRKAVKA